MIASNTKGLTTLLLAKLVDEGRIGWKDPVTKIMPGLRLGDEKKTLIMRDAQHEYVFDAVPL